MKIQSTTPKGSLTNTKKKKSSSASFEALFSSKIENEVQVKEEGSQQNSSPHAQHPNNIEETLHSLEKSIQNLSDNPQTQLQAQDVISKLRQTLKSQSNLSAKDMQEIDVLLAVEYKRLEMLIKNNISS